MTHGSALALACIVAVAAGCASQPREAATNGSRCGPARPFAEGGERATLWVRQSAEFRAASEIIYRAAATALVDNLADTSVSAESSQQSGFSGLPPAVVMDIDDTVLDNSAPQARMILEVTCPPEFSALWDEWVARRAAPAVPGAADFIRAARAMKDAAGRPVRVFFITNRECSPRAGSADPCPQQEDTLENLRALGLDAPTLADDLMLKGERADWPSEKESRRHEVARSHRIVLNVGDDFGDFLPGVRRQSVAARERARCAHRDWWGSRWFLVPNPMYGSWQAALGPGLEAALALPASAEDCPGP
ncbi:MAG TPA: HAD family acid phosphatase [Steroidobacteraceae bacterium]|nr:HAD family acid phosphatase [Steroidobacteraceae bacterium]